mgnify:CR=1 FL=1
MRKLISVLCLLAMFAAALLPAQAQAEQIRVGALTGPTAMGMAELLGNDACAPSIFGSADELTPLILKGEVDLAAVPANLAATLYNKTEGGVTALAVNVLGVLYICAYQMPEIASLEDLRGQTLYATGKGATPEYALTYLLAQNGLTLGRDVTVEWKSEPSEIVALMAQEEHAIAMLPQPFVTVAQGKLEGLQVSLDLSAQWDKLGVDSRLVTAGLLVRKAFADEHPQAVAKFLEEYAASTDYANTHAAETAALVEKMGIVSAAVAEKALPGCNLVCITGKEMKTAVSGYLQTLYDLKSESVGGAMPTDGFYWLGA